MADEGEVEMSPDALVTGPTVLDGDVERPATWQELMTPAEHPFAVLEPVAPAYSEADLVAYFAVHCTNCGALLDGRDHQALEAGSCLLGANEQAGDVEPIAPVAAPQFAP